MDDLKDRMNMFLTYDMDLHNKQRPKKSDDHKGRLEDETEGLKIERFFNKD